MASLTVSKPLELATTMGRPLPKGFAGIAPKLEAHSEATLVAKNVRRCTGGNIFGSAPHVVLRIWARADLWILTSKLTFLRSLDQI
jgi:hypothetical protein